ncbi:MAG: 16S rRNA (guanine(527)-N(7))-methyltransferase RsmG [Aquisalinus sp.]|nr:16S rRNA (guanine(527)-N(7))-methyltransferase RsmG [Aquisalinus sp.]
MAKSLSGPDLFFNTYETSERTRDSLLLFDQLFLDWSGRLNLVARSTLPDRWQRHYLDSAQLRPLIPSAAKVVMDFGSGAGFPGLFLAILSADDPARQSHDFFLVESIAKKCAFLREVITVLGLQNVTVLNQRIETISEPEKADIITARALADLDTLCEYGHRFMHKTSKCLFQKGERAQEEIEVAQRKWSFDVTSHNSLTHKAAAILEIRNLKRV